MFPTFIAEVLMLNSRDVIEYRKHLPSIFELNKEITRSNSLYGDLLAASCVTQIAVAEESDLKVKMLKLIFQVFNNFSLFYVLVINETDIKKSGFVLEMEAGMYTQSSGCC